MRTWSGRGGGRHDDIDDARVYDGIHFRFDQDAGARQGRRIGRYVLRNYLTRSRK